MTLLLPLFLSIALAAEPPPAEPSAAQSLPPEAEPPTGTLVVTTEPSGLSVRLDGGEARPTTATFVGLAPGPHTLELVDPCWRAEPQPVEVRAGLNSPTQLAVSPRMVTVSFSLRTAEDETLTGAVYADGVKLGIAPGTFEAPLCAQEFAFETPGFARNTSIPRLVEGEPTRVTATLSREPENAALSASSSQTTSRTIVVEEDPAPPPPAATPPPRAVDLAPPPGRGYGLALRLSWQPGAWFLGQQPCEVAREGDPCEPTGSRGEQYRRASGRGDSPLGFELEAKGLWRGIVGGRLALGAIAWDAEPDGGPFGEAGARANVDRFELEVVGGIAAHGDAGICSRDSLVSASPCVVLQPRLGTGLRDLPVLITGPGQRLTTDLVRLVTDRTDRVELPQLRLGLTAAVDLGQLFQVRLDYAVGLSWHAWPHSTAGEAVDLPTAFQEHRGTLGGKIFLPVPGYASGLHLDVAYSLEIATGTLPWTQPGASGATALAVRNSLLIGVGFALW